MKEKKCKECGEKFKQERPLQYLCSPLCAMKYARTLEMKKEAKRLKVVKESLLTKSDYLKMAQQVFNAYIRKRDEKQPCISCGATRYTMSCGHYFPSGTYKAVTFDEDNCHGQCWYNCNSSKSGNLIEYRKGLISRIGIERLEALEERARKEKKWTIDELKELIKIYKSKIKEHGKN